MPNDLYPSPDAQLSRKRRELAPDTAASFAAFSKQVFADGALPARTKQLIAVAVAHVTQCPYCIKGHTSGALRAGASEAEIMEAIWVAAEMRAGGSFAHSIIALLEMERVEQSSAGLQGSID
jgi:AhpD family alkylhydroperoxidase